MAAASYFDAPDCATAATARTINGGQSLRVK
jgi:hypothetical protein